MQLGNLHPLFVHLPIGILLMAFLMELYYRKKPEPKDNGIVLFTLGIGAISSLLSIITGWFLGDNGGYDEQLLDQHRWIAVAFSVGSIALFFLKKSSANQAQKFYLPSFVVVLVLLTLTGHYGGSLTHGEDFLFATKYEEPVIENVEKAAVFSEIVQPILQRKCVSCHNAGKAKGGLLLESEGNLMAGGDSGSLLDSLEQEGMSLLMHRLHLPVENEEHMPPKGKVQLTSEEVMLLEWWMENKHCFDCLVEDLHHEGKLTSALEALEKDTSSEALLADEVDEVPEDFITLLSQNDISAQLVSEEMPLLSVNFLKRKNLSEADFELLVSYKENVVGLNLGHTNLDDELIKQLKPFKNLIKLQLQHTQITNAGLNEIKRFKLLESLNLYSTEVDDAGLDQLSKLSKLKKLFVWQTPMTSEGLAAFKEQHRQVEIQGQIADSVFAASTLGPPTIVAEHEIFMDSIQISLEQFFDGAKLHYVLEDSQNDTLPKEYTGPFYINETTTLRTFATLEGWEPSLESTRNFLKSRVEVDKVSLGTTPHPKYSGNGGETLIDYSRGTINFVDGRWLGFEGKHMTATVEFKEPTVVSRIAVGSLSVPTNWIFRPVGYTVWGSVDGQSYTRLKSIDLPLTAPSIDIERLVYDIEIPPTILKKIRLRVKSQLKNPDWHPSPGGKSFIFLDELVFN
ncbi:DUF2231 domain-containing protein [Flagellimonas myxillae]|uniref:DUF2231 domain-containing protein n=1 Tax=Flagellimonas myxillae TaxID=2942214 RepID=UPI00201E8E81|nr:DUF2231 domain-containing protein [Muricauda myxillae]MCL6267091.1 hypothetical protein [Muricauda myxillae]